MDNIVSMKNINGTKNQRRSARFISNDPVPDLPFLHDLKTVSSNNISNPKLSPHIGDDYEIDLPQNLRKKKKRPTLVKKNSNRNILMQESENFGFDSMRPKIIQEESEEHDEEADSYYDMMYRAEDLDIQQLHSDKRIANMNLQSGRLIKNVSFAEN